MGSASRSRPVAWEQFNEHMPTPNQIHRKREDVQVTAADLVEVPKGTITEQGLRMNCSVGVQYIASWLSGNGAAPINNLMEDAATAEISRTQVWQWIRHPEGKLDDGRNITIQLAEQILTEELGKLKATFGNEGYANGRYTEAAELFLSLISKDEFVEFLTLPGYEKIS